ncbi:hypothetical protein PR202_gb24924 [Eleusine coracana subsp. coracana]|uniref:Uncharacterized protein n=1 Tax=Eleusine coracana subsp. coracana TaxID=191504 RepID=A0AAV5FJX5_ELECO|nr:hypothetical protein PR202_gb24924 [Eleusine coracana subsp. coracana]
MAMEDATEELLHLKLAFLAGEPPTCILALARKAGGGSITHVQHFLLENCTSTDKDSVLNRPDHIYKEISFLSSTRLVSMVARLSCSSNMLEGDTGCSLWPSSLFLSEFILSHPNVFSKKCCFELGSGVGLVGICLNYIGASKVILTDGDASTLTNMKENMELNNLCIEGENSKLAEESKNKVECKYLSWEEVSVSDLLGYQPDLVLGADIIYDPVCVPHLTRVLSMLLRRDHEQGETKERSGEEFATQGPVAYIATVVRNVDTFNCFVKAAADSKLSILNITSDAAPANFLPYMLSYDRSSVHLLRVTSLS